MRFCLMSMFNQQNRKTIKRASTVKSVKDVELKIKKSTVSNTKSDNKSHSFAFSIVVCHISIFKFVAVPFFVDYPKKVNHVLQKMIVIFWVCLSHSLCTSLSSTSSSSSLNTHPHVSFCQIIILIRLTWHWSSLKFLQLILSTNSHIILPKNVHVHV